MFDAVDWQEIFGRSVSPVELIVRGTAMFWFLFALFRIVLRREVGSVAMADILIFVIIADAAQNGMAGEYRSVTDGMILIGTIVGWNVGVDWLAFRFALFSRLLEPPPLVLVRNGRVMRRALHSQLMTLDELRSKLRAATNETIPRPGGHSIRIGRLAIIRASPRSVATFSRSRRRPGSGF
jgi:uncharacterized membrane protein YcaP (DUF421 family)